MGVIITGSGSVLPKQIIKNSYFESFEFYGKDGKKIEKNGSDIIEKLESISGIKERRFIEDSEESIDILADASRKAIEDAQISPNELDAIIVAHNAGNMLSSLKGRFSTAPNLGALLKNRLGITNYKCRSYDVLFGCPGWVEGCIQANLLIKSGEAKHVMVCGVEVASRALDPYNMDSMLMGDGCGVTIISEEPSKKGIVSSSTYSHAEKDIDNIVLGDSLNPNAKKSLYFNMNGREVYRYATTWLPKVIKESLAKVGYTPNDIDLFFFHQANKKMLEVIASNLMKLYDQKINDYSHKIPSTIEFLGNTSVATVPTLYDRVSKGHLDGFKIEPGKKMVFASVGAGMHCNAFVYEN